MNTRQKFTLAAGIGLMVLVVGFLDGPQIVMGIQTMANGRQSCGALGEWPNMGATPAELAAQSDLIVRVRVIKSETRELRQMLPNGPRTERQ